VDEHLANLDEWMKKQRPVILASRSGLSVAPVSENLIVLLQPTRVVSRKRIQRDLILIRALFRKSALREEFENNPNRQLVLHITGPTPKEHRADLETILLTYKKIVHELPQTLGERIFLAFSVGHQRHKSFSKKGFTPLTIEAIYRMADAVVFPSETEGRGLPIIEASAAGIPIICSKYHPRKVFNEVIGKGLSDALRIKYIKFPEKKFKRKMLSDVADLLMETNVRQEVIRHNKNAVRTRYSVDTLKNKFERLLNHLVKSDRSYALEHEGPEK
jgi:glycosyltransferase involved in cell wall biosynthesis